MRILFVHQNFPGQYKNLLIELAKERDHELVFITQRANLPIAGVRRILYEPAARPAPATHPYLLETAAAVLNAQAVYRVASDLEKEGFIPDIILGHNGWGETLYLKEVYPDVPLLGYFEFYYRSHDSDIDFDPEYPSSIDIRLRTHTLNAVNHIGWQVADWGQSPTAWQKAQYPAWCHDKMSVIHEGIDTDSIVPDPAAFILLKNDGLCLTLRDEVITFVSRNLEPHRGFHVFMRALPAIQKRRPNAHILIVGGDDVSYGMRLPAGESYRLRMLNEVGSQLDFRRIHFLGSLAYRDFINVLQISSAHVYLTYPFVLSWSMLEAMAAGCLVIGSKTGPVDEVIQHGQNGLLVDFFSPAAIADGIDQVLEHPDRMKALRENARATIVNRFDLTTQCLPRLRALLEDLVARRSPPRA